MFLRHAAPSTTGITASVLNNPWEANDMSMARVAALFWRMPVSSMAPRMASRGKLPMLRKKCTTKGSDFRGDADRVIVFMPKKTRPRPSAT